MNSKPIIFFDFDGTILNSFSLYFQTTRYLFPEMTESEYREIFTHKDFNTTPIISRENKQEFFNLIALHSHLYDIFPDVLENLQTLSRHYELVIITACPKHIVKYQLSRFELPRFAKIYGQEKAGCKSEKITRYCHKTNIDESQCYFVTDTLGDLHQANDTQVRTIAVSYGFHDADTLSQGNPQHICHNFGDVANIILDHKENRP